MHLKSYMDRYTNAVKCASVIVYVYPRIHVYPLNATWICLKLYTDAKSVRVSM